MPPITIKMMATTPAIPTTQLMTLTTISPGLETHSELELEIQSAERLASPRTIRMVFKMTLAQMTMTRPMRARVRVFLPLATLPESPFASI